MLNQGKGEISRMYGTRGSFFIWGEVGKERFRPHKTELLS
jgi:hypothetical protein